MLCSPSASLAGGRPIRKSRCTGGSSTGAPPQPCWNSGRAHSSSQSAAAAAAADCDELCALPEFQQGWGGAPVDDPPVHLDFRIGLPPASEALGEQRMFAVLDLGDLGGGREIWVG